MAVKTKEELLESVKAKLGDDTSDEALSIIEDISDTIDSRGDAESVRKEWEEKYNRLDSDWRSRYRDRFFSREENETETKETEIKQEEDTSEEITFDDLFKEE